MVTLPPSFVDFLSSFFSFFVFPPLCFHFSMWFGFLCFFFFSTSNFCNLWFFFLDIVFFFSVRPVLWFVHLPEQLVFFFFFPPVMFFFVFFVPFSPFFSFFLFVFFDLFAIYPFCWYWFFFFVFGRFFFFFVQIFIFFFFSPTKLFCNLPLSISLGALILMFLPVCCFGVVGCCGFFFFSHRFFRLFRISLCPVFLFFSLLVY